MIKVERKNEGEYVAWRQEGKYLELRGGELTVDLSMLERDYPVHVDFCEDAFGLLVMAPSRRYVAQVDIPARRYETVEEAPPAAAQGEGGEPGPGGGMGGGPGAGMGGSERKALPFDPDLATLTLWALGAEGTADGEA